MTDQLALSRRAMTLGSVFGSRADEFVVAPDQRALSGAVPRDFLVGPERHLYRVRPIGAHSPQAAPSEWRVVSELPFWHIYGPNGRSVAALIGRWPELADAVREALELEFSPAERRRLAALDDTSAAAGRPSAYGLNKIVGALNNHRAFEFALGQAALLLVWRDRLDRDRLAPLIELIEER